MQGVGFERSDAEIIRSCLANGSPCPRAAAYGVAHNRVRCVLACGAPVKGRCIVLEGLGFLHAYPCRSEFAHAGGPWSDGARWVIICRCGVRLPASTSLVEAHRLHLEHGIGSVLADPA